MKDPQTPDPRSFATTHWSIVLAARPDEAGQTRARAALEELCRAYWYPLYAFVRSRGHSPNDAQDLTQSFFARILEKGGLAAADPRRGRFRSYLLGAMKHFLANEWHRARTKRRGGGATLLDLDSLGPEQRYAQAEVTSDPDATFDREWAQDSIARAMERLRREWDARGGSALFEALKGSLISEASDRAEIARRLGMSDGAVKVAIHRLRQRYRELVRAGIAETVADPSEVDAEMRHLLAALRTK